MYLWFAAAIRNKIELMRLRFVLPAVLIGAGLLLPVQTPAVAKTSYKAPKAKKYKARKFKKHKTARHKAVRPTVAGRARPSGTGD